jgi:hypothetical protein
MKRVVYLIEQPLDQRNFERFGIQIWIDHDWAVEVWDLTRWAHPYVWKNYVESGREPKGFTGYFSIASMKQLRSRLSEFAPIECFVDLTGENYRCLRVKSSLNRRGAMRIVCDAGSIPVPQSAGTGGLVSKLRKAVAKGPTKFFNALVSAVLRKISESFVRPGLAIVSGERSISSARQSREIVKAHSFDYDTYLRLARSNAAPAGNYAVFVDQNLCFHTDFMYQDVPFFITPEKYFPAICGALNEIARSLGVDVRIAAHPRASREELKSDYWNGFQVVYGRTAELIQNCKVVVCHDSTAIHFAVLFEKPIIFVTTDELLPFFEGRSIAQAASEFGKLPLNCDRDLQGVDWQKEAQVDSGKYAAYKNEYIKAEGSPERPMWEIVVDCVERRRLQTFAGLSDKSAYAGDRG